jgi:uncharacterized membrane protein YfcA
VFENLDIWIILWCSFALACGGLIKGTLGVGTPLLTVPLMALVLPVQSAIAIMAIPVVVANVMQFFQAERSIEVVKNFWPTFLCLLIGTWFGVEILATINERNLLLMVGGLVIVFTFLQGSSRKLLLPDKWVRPAGVGFGLASGVIGGVSSMFGPMFIIYLISIKNLEKNQFVSIISFLYMGAVIPWTIILIWFGILDTQLLILSAFATIPVTLGLLVGRTLRSHVSEQKFQKLVLVVLLCSGGTMLWRALVV